MVRLTLIPDRVIMNVRKTYRKRTMDNELILELCHKVGLSVIDGGVYGNRWYSSKCGFDLAEVQALVKVVAKECAKIVLETPVEYNEIEAMHRIRDSIKYTFGVE